MTLLILGTGNNIKLKPKWLQQLFKKQIDFRSINVIDFRCGSNQSYGVFDMLSLNKWQQVYNEFQTLTTSEETFDQISKHLENLNTVICHSSGCTLFNNYCLNRPLPEQLKKIIFIQADMCADSKLNFVNKETQIKFTNLYCNYDTSLIFGKYILKHNWQSAGLKGFENYPKSNKFSPLSRINPVNHNSTIMNPRLLSQIIKLY